MSGGISLDSLGQFVLNPGSLINLRVLLPVINRKLKSYFAIMAEVQVELVCLSSGDEEESEAVRNEERMVSATQMAQPSI